ncbi:MAG: ABC transporter ATP-binding protein [Caldiserica bacterium]|nr:ABC transporter ATP-binding protein [Caldisericota bacterium]
MLECLGGLRRPREGHVLLGDADLYELSPRERARAIGYVPQVHRPVFGYSVLEVVLMGRTPHLGIFSSPGREDRRIALDALEAVGLSGYAGRPYTELSGGEMRLVLIARGLAQEARFLLLDEPDAHLDPRHQHGVLSLVRGFASRGLATLVTTHNPTNALLYARRVALLQGGSILAHGPAEDVLTPGRLREAYGMEFVLLAGENGHRALIPAQGMLSSASADRERGTGSASSRASSESLPAT